MAAGRPHSAEVDTGRAVVEGAYKLGELKGHQKKWHLYMDRHTWHLSHSRCIHSYKIKGLRNNSFSLNFHSR
jgi:hypothetical protein